jgi:hypothetical protein
MGMSTYLFMRVMAAAISITGEMDRTQPGQEHHAVAA